MLDAHTATLSHSDIQMRSDTQADVHGYRHRTQQQTGAARTTERSTNY